MSDSHSRVLEPMHAVRLRMELQQYILCVLEAAGFSPRHDVFINDVSREHLRILCGTDTDVLPVLEFKLTKHTEDVLVVSAHGGSGGSGG